VRDIRKYILAKHLAEESLDPDIETFIVLVDKMSAAVFNKTYSENEKKINLGKVNKNYIKKLKMGYGGVTWR
jgi:hypothetical protein